MNGNSGRAGRPPERGFAASDACEWSLLDTMERPLARLFR